METAPVRCYGTGGWGSDWKLQQCDVTAPVGGGQKGNCSSEMLRHRWAGVRLETAAVQCYGTDRWGSDWKLQQCDVTAPVGMGLTGKCNSAMLRHRWLWV